MGSVSDFQFSDFHRASRLDVVLILIVVVAAHAAHLVTVI